MRYLLLTFFHLRIFFRKNIRNYILFLIEIILSVTYVSAFASTIFSEFNYKINYLKDYSYEQYAILALDNSITNNMFYSSKNEQYYEFAQTLKEKADGVTDISFVTEFGVKINGQSVTNIQLDDSFEEFYHPTVGGKWLSPGDNNCILAGSLCEQYNIGDICSFEGASYTVIDYLESPSYLFDTTVGGSLNMITVLTNPGDAVITMPEAQLPYIYCSLVIEFDPQQTSIQNLKDSYAKYGTVYSMDELIERSASTRNELIMANLPLFIAIIVICLIIANSGLLISAQNNKKNHSIFLMLGGTKAQLISFTVVIQGLLLLLGWSVGTLLANKFCYELVGISNIVPEAKYFSAGILGAIFIINLINILVIYSKNSLSTYRASV